MTGPEHYQRAAWLIEQAENHRAGPDDPRQEMFFEAAVHAQMATAAAAALAAAHGHLPPSAMSDAVDRWREAGAW